MTTSQACLFDRSSERQGEVEKSAAISPDGRYRYSLTRRWADGPAMVCCGLNPSVADAAIDDPTIRKCVSFAKREHCDALVMINLFAWRSTDPMALLTAAEAGEDPFGPENAASILLELRGAKIVVAAWGESHLATAAGRSMFGRRTAAILNSLAARTDVYRFGVPTKAGHPRHPLYLANDTPIVLHRARGT